MNTYRNQLIFIKDKESKSSLLKHAVFLILPCVQSNSTEWCHVEKIGILFVDNNKWPLFLSRWLGICITPTKLPSFTLKSTNLGQGHLSKIIPCQKSQNISITKVPSKDNEHHEPLGVCCCQEGGVGVDANLGGLIVDNCFSDVAEILQACERWKLTIAIPNLWMWNFS